MPQKFGDERTIEKLEIIEEYAELFVTVLSQGRFRPDKHYIDAFAGEGYLFVKGKDELVEGSVKRIGQLGFQRFHFIELNKRKCNELKKVADELGIKEKSLFYQKDANDALPRIVNRLTKKERSLVFIDPFGMQLKWDTLRKISKIPYCDIVYLFPGHAVLRAMPTRNGGSLHEDMKDKICSCLGMSESEIVSTFYSIKPPPPQMPLFDEMQEKPTLVRETGEDGYNKVEKLVYKRLQSIFKYVYDSPYALELKGEATLYSIYLMTTNPSEKAKDAIRRLGRHVFK